MPQQFQVIGLMSGTSLDGLDIACCNFEYHEKKWKYEILDAETFNYTEEWKRRLDQTMDYTAREYVLTHVELGKFYGELVNEFLKKYHLKPLLIASHGHTVFHQPQNGFTAQIGDGAQIAALTGIATICDFRSKDVALGGQGAPLVPAGEIKLFADFRFCLNLGGIANISVLNGDQTIAFDIGPSNMALNYLAGEKGLSYDRDGLLAMQGSANAALLAQLNELSFYKQNFPKSLGREWFKQEMQPLLERSKISTTDKLATVCEHIAVQIGQVISRFQCNKNEELLVTGGGAFNPVLIKCIRKHAPVSIKIPDSQTIAYKEALIFAFLGLLFFRDEINVLKSVTGASQNHIGGALYKGSWL